MGVVVRTPPAAVGTLLCTWAIDQWARSQDTFFFNNHWLTNTLTTVILLMALGLRVVKGRTVFRPVTREYVNLVALYGFALLSIIWSISPNDTINQFVAGYKTIVVFAFLMPLAITSFDDLKASLYTLLTVGFAITLLVLFTGRWNDRQLMMNVSATLVEEKDQYGNPLAIGTIGSYVAIAGMLMNFRGAGGFWKWLRYATVGAGFALSVKSGSRGQTVAIIFSTLCFLPYSRRFKDLRGFIAFAISMALFSLLTLYLLSVMTQQGAVGEHYSDRWSLDSFIADYNDGRVNQSAILLARWAISGPIYWIVGLGSSASFDPTICGFYPHMVFAEVLGELGLIGWTLLWLFPIFTTQSLRQLWPHVKDDPEHRGLVATLGSLILFEIILSFKQGSLLGSPVAFAFIVILGRVWATARQEALVYQQLDAGGYPMSDADWSETSEAYDEQLPGGAVVARS